MGKYRGLDTEEGWIRRELAEIKRELAEQAAARRLGLVADMRQANLDPAPLTGAWTDYLTTAVTPPIGYNRAIVQMIATAGISLSTGIGGNVGVQPVAGGVAGIGQSDGGGGTGGAGAGVSVTTGLAVKLTVVGGVPFNLLVRSYATAGYDVNTGNVRFSAAILYLRE